MPDIKDNLISDEMSEKIIETVEELVKINGAHTITVRMVLKELDITNRVFYNRFHNIDEVLQLVYKNSVLKMREGVPLHLNVKSKEEFFERVMEMLEKTLVISYDVRDQFNQYVFEHDAMSRSNFEWWVREIKKLSEYAKSKGFIKNDVDSDLLSYSVWCFCKGYNADMLGRKFSKEEAIKHFRYGFGVFFDGIMA